LTLSVMFASQTGNAEGLAKRIAKEAGKRGFAATVHDLAQYPIEQLASESRVLIVASTYGDGEPPDNTKPFWDRLCGSSASKLAQTKYSVCALGDTNYPKFCGFGEDLDKKLTALGATCVHPRVNCDLDFEETFAKWQNEVLSALSAAEGAQASSLRVSSQGNNPTGRASNVSQSIYSRNHPFPAPLTANRKLTGGSSEKDTRHFEISLDGSGLTYEAGDALGVYPANCSSLVNELLDALKFSGDELVPGRENTEVLLREALSRHYEITKIPVALLQAVSEQTGDESLKKVASPTANGELTQFLQGRDAVDLLRAHPTAKFSPTEFIGFFKKLAPRLYSISSSPKAHPGQVHLTVSVVRYESLGRPRKGVCSTFLAERVEASSPVPVFVHANKVFRPPSNPDTSIVMVGPGTGIAPFRAFLHERRVMGAKGKNWLFFGDQRMSTDFMYREELETMQRDGFLTRLDTAFSRDQPEKIYVQHRMREQARELFSWLEAGAHFYVCGDALRMAKDVDAALHDVIQTAGNRTVEEAADYINHLKTEKRYQRDVY
ncbi:MAG: sulfite reductase subunit alpha, partial [Verrucomicrobiota bacterium]